MDAPVASLQPIVLAHEAPFTIGSLTVRPETCELSGQSGNRVIEPRVMQVLVALHRANGHVVSRDDLLQCCWSGRIVGEDAIHRVISRLRHEAEAAGGEFRIETITRVGYRLMVNGSASPAAGNSGPARDEATPSLSRRKLLAGAGGIVALAAGGIAWRRWSEPELPPAAEAKIRDGYELWRLGSIESYAAAQSAFREATALAPDFAKPWGLLALSYSYQARSGPPNAYGEATRQAQASMARALAIDSHNAEALSAGIQIDYGQMDYPLAKSEERIQAILREDPRSPVALRMQTYFLDQVGRGQAALAAFKLLKDADPLLDAISGAAYGYCLFKAGRVDEADRQLDEVLERWPRHVASWFTQLKVLLYSRRLDRALAMLDDLSRRPVGVPEWNFALTRAQILGFANPAANLDKAIADSLASAPKGTGFAENAALYLSANNRLDEAFGVSQALLEGKGFQVSSQRFTQEQGHFDNRRRRTAFLFEPATAPMRRDPRFAELTRITGLDDYWRATGTKPDYRALSELHRPSIGPKSGAHPV